MGCVLLLSALSILLMYFYYYLVGIVLLLFILIDSGSVWGDQGQAVKPLKLQHLCWKEDPFLHTLRRVCFIKESVSVLFV